MENVLDIPEVAALNAARSTIRIPDQIDVPVTPRVLKIIDSEPFQRLIGVRQLGMVPLVYPAANHNRFEHSLGVYRMALLFLRRLGNEPRFKKVVSVKQCEAFILAALLHDIAHWPFCHLVEDIGLEEVPNHESLARTYLSLPEISETISNDWQVEPDAVIGLIEGKKSTPAEALLCSMLSGPIDVDKMDYLYRDSLHAGVPYGKNFDSPRLIGSLCVNGAGDKLAISEKGRTAAELMVFARYVMFSEVYWHHAVRSATAMFQRGFYDWVKAGNIPDQVYLMNDVGLISELKGSNVESTRRFVEAIFGTNRKLFKRLLSFSYLENEKLFSAIAHRPFEWLVRCGSQFAKLLGEKAGCNIGPDQILIDAPPVGLEVQFEVDVFYKRANAFRSLGSVSPVVNTLAQRQFDDHVKQVRIFIAPELADQFRDVDGVELLRSSIAATV